MNSAIDVHRLHFAFTVTFHYIFPQLTMGLALLIVVLKSLALFKRDELYSNAARFWARIFARARQRDFALIAAILRQVLYTVVQRSDTHCRGPGPR